MTQENRPQSLPLYQRIAHALPDAVTAGIFLYAWIAPLHWRDTLVAELLLVMLIEFILVHSAPFLGGIVTASHVALVTRLKVFTGLALFYSLFIGVFAIQFESWLPVLAFVWLIAAKLISIFSDRHHTERQKQRIRIYWGLSFSYYLIAVLATQIVPVPEFGLTQHGSAYGILSISGAWVSHPNTVIAAGFLYFASLTATKLFEQPAWWSYVDQNAIKKD